MYGNIGVTMAEAIVSRLASLRMDRYVKRIKKKIKKSEEEGKAQRGLGGWVGM